MELNNASQTLKARSETLNSPCRSAEAKRVHVSKHNLQHSLPAVKSEGLTPRNQDDSQITMI